MASLMLIFFAVIYLNLRVIKISTLYKEQGQNSAQRSRIAEVPEIEFLQLGRGVTFFNYAALLKYNRITEAEKICFVAGILAMQC